MADNDIAEILQLLCGSSSSATTPSPDVENTEKLRKILAQMRERQQAAGQQATGPQAAGPQAAEQPQMIVQPRTVNRPSVPELCQRLCVYLRTNTCAGLLRVDGEEFDVVCNKGLFFMRKGTRLQLILITEANLFGEKPFIIADMKRSATMLSAKGGFKVISTFMDCMHGGLYYPRDNNRAYIIDHAGVITAIMENGDILQINGMAVHPSLTKTLPNTVCITLPQPNSAGFLILNINKTYYMPKPFLQNVIAFWNKGHIEAFNLATGERVEIIEVEKISAMIELPEYTNAQYYLAHQTALAGFILLLANEHAFIMDLQTQYIMKLELKEGAVPLTKAAATARVQQAFDQYNERNSRYRSTRQRPHSQAHDLEPVAGSWGDSE